MALWLGHWIPNPEVSDSKPMGFSKVDSAFHSFEIDQIRTSPPTYQFLKNEPNQNTGVSRLTNK